MWCKLTIAEKCKAQGKLNLQPVLLGYLGNVWLVPEGRENLSQIHIKSSQLYHKICWKLSVGAPVLLLPGPLWEAVYHCMDFIWPPNAVLIICLPIVLGFCFALEAVIQLFISYNPPPQKNNNNKKKKKQQNNLSGRTVSLL